MRSGSIKSIIGNVTDHIYLIYQYKKDLSPTMFNMPKKKKQNKPKPNQTKPNLVRVNENAR